MEDQHCRADGCGFEPVPEGLWDLEPDDAPAPFCPPPGGSGGFLPDAAGKGEEPAEFAGKGEEPAGSAGKGEEPAGSAGKRDEMPGSAEKGGGLPGSAGKTENGPKRAGKGGRKAPAAPEEKARSRRDTPPYTAFTDQPARLYCPGYTCTDEGVRAADGRLVCLHPIMPAGALRNADDGACRLEVAFNAEGHWETHALPREKLASPTGILDLAALGAAVTSENARPLSAYLTRLFYENQEVLGTRLSLGRLGWVSPFSDDFVPYTDAVAPDLPPAQKRRFEAIRLRGTADAWNAAVLPAVRGCTQARLALDASFASVLLGPLELQPFFVHIWGMTGMGKTVLLQMAASVWGDPRPGALIGTFNATEVGLENAAAFLHDLPVCIDELQILTAAGRADFQSTVYMLSEGTGRTRGAKEGGLRRQNTWNNIFITTGERPLTNALSGGGAVNRCIEIELPFPLTEDFAPLVTALQNNHGHAGLWFVQTVRQRRRVLRQIWEGHVRGLAEYGATGKQAAAMAALLTADDILLTGPYGEGEAPLAALEYDEAASYLVPTEDVCREKAAVEYLFDTVAANPAKFPEKRSPYSAAEVWGRPHAEYTAVIGTVFDRLMRDAGYDPKAVLHYAARMGLLQTDGSHLRKKVSFGSQYVRCVVIKQE